MPDLPPDVPPPVDLIGCTMTAPPGTAVASQFGPFVGDRAYFGTVTVTGQILFERA